MKRISSTYRTKRRKIQKELEVLNNWSDDNHSCNLEIDPNIYSIQYSQNLNLPDQLNAVNDRTFNSIDTQLYMSSPELGCKVITNSNPDVHTNQDVNSKEEYIKQSLSQWVVSCNVPQITVNKLLNILKFDIPLTFLSKDCRTLLKTGSLKILNIREVNPGNYYHFGLKEGIIRYSSILSLSEHIMIAIGVDGLPISKSSSSQLWPILAYIMPHNSYVFPVRIYHGYQKPQDSNDFLHDFITEVLELTTNGIIINNQVKKVTVEVICCDVPAKSFLL